MNFQGQHISNLIQFAALQGNAEGLMAKLEQEGLPPGQLEDGLDLSTYNYLISEILSFTKDPFFGLHLGEHYGLSIASLVLQIVEEEQSLLDALTKLVHTLELHWPSIPLELEEQQKNLEVAFHISRRWFHQAPRVAQHTLDNLVLITLIAFHILTRGQLKPIRIHFAYNFPGYLKEYDRLFRVPVYFGKSQTTVYFEWNAEIQPPNKNDLARLQSLVDQTQEEIQDLSHPKDFIQSIQYAVLNIINPNFPSIEQMAVHLNFSIRTLQRKLKQEHYTYKSLVDQMKREFALKYLENPALDLRDIAYLLDYSETRTFVRTFKRWENISPKDYRDRS